MGAGRRTGERIEAARKTAGLSQGDVARAFGVRQQTVSNWESGKTNVPQRHRRRLAKMLGIDLADLLGWISADEETKHKATRREVGAAATASGQLFETVKMLERFVNQYQEIGHTYRRLDDTSEKMLVIVQQLSDQQQEILRLLKDLANS